MVPYSASFIRETVTVSMHGVGHVGNMQVSAGDTLEDLGLTRLRLLAVLIDLEDKFAIEFPADAIDGFRNVDDVTFYIQSHAMTPDDVAADRQAVATCHSIDPRQSIRDRVRWVRAQAWPWCRNLLMAPHTGPAPEGARPS